MIKRTNISNMVRKINLTQKKNSLYSTDIFAFVSSINFLENKTTHLYFPSSKSIIFELEKTNSNFFAVYATYEDFMNLRLSAQI